MKEAVIYMIRTDTVRKTCWNQLAERMPQRTERAMRYRFEKDRLLCLGAGLLMTEALGIRDEREIRYGENGKPYVPGLPAFNISHSGRWCILVRREAGDIGADIEEINARHIDLAPRVYTVAETAWMEEDPVNRFFRLWTWKESVMKATGMGMSLEPQSFEVLPFTEGKPARVLGRDWYAWQEKTENGFLSICADEPIGQVRRVELDEAYFEEA